MLADGGVRRGQVDGASDRLGAYVQSGRLISHADFGATLFHDLGVPPETRYGPDGFSRGANAGMPLKEVFGERVLPHPAVCGRIDLCSATPISVVMLTCGGLSTETSIRSNSIGQWS